MIHPPQVTYIARTNGRDRPRLFGIRDEDRRHHMYVVGATGTGKTTLLEFLMTQQFDRKEGFALLDPHGDLAGRIAKHALLARGTDVIAVNPHDPSCRYRFVSVQGVRRPAVGAMPTPACRTCVP